MKLEIIFIISFTILIVSTSDVQSNQYENQPSHSISDGVSRLNYLQKVEILTFNRGNIKGKFLELKSDSIYLNIKFEIVAINLSDIQSIQIKKSYMSTFVMIGGAFGAYTGYASGSDLTSYTDNKSFSIILTAIGGAIGLGGGAILGKVSESYEKIYVKSEEVNVNNTQGDFTGGYSFNFKLIPDSKKGLLLSATLNF